jgi:hypothetical protein
MARKERFLDKKFTLADNGFGTAWFVIPKRLRLKKLIMESNALYNADNDIVKINLINSDTAPTSIGDCHTAGITFDEKWNLMEAANGVILFTTRKEYDLSFIVLTVKRLHIAIRNELGAEHKFRAILVYEREN